MKKNYGENTSTQVDNRDETSNDSKLMWVSYAWSSQANTQTRHLLCKIKLVPIWIIRIMYCILIRISSMEVLE